MKSPRLAEMLELYVEDRLDAAEQAELTTLLRSDPEARRCFWEAIEQHAAIKAILSASRGRDLARVEQMQLVAESTPTRSMSQDNRPGTARSQVAWRLLATGLALAFLVFLFMPGGWFQRRAMTSVALAQVVELDGELVIQSPTGGTRTAGLGADVFDGETLRVNGRDGLAVFEYADRSRYEISTGTTVRLTQAAGKKSSAKELFLVEGIVRPTVKNAGPVVITTPNAQLQLPSTSFVVSTHANEPLRVDVADGEATVVRTSDQQAVTIHSGESVVVHGDAQPMEVSPMPMLSSEPVREIALRDAISGMFLADSRSFLAFTRKEQWMIQGEQRESASLPAVIASASLTPSHGGTSWAYWGADRRVWMWDAAQRRNLGHLPDPFPDEPLLCLSADGNLLATVDSVSVTDRRPRKVRIWEVASGRLLWSQITNVSVRNLAFSPDGALLALGVGDLGRTQDRHTYLLDGRTGEPRGQMPMVLAHQFALSFSPDGQTLVTSFPNSIQLWDVHTCTLLQTIEGHRRLFTSVVYSPDGHLLAGRSLEGEIWMWKVASGEHLAALGGSQRRLLGIAFSPDGMHLLTRSNDRLLVWDVMAPTLVQ